MRKMFMATVALAVLALFISIAASTVHAQSIIYACKNESSGTLTIVSGGTTCRNNEALISWSSVDDDTLGDLVCSAGQTVKFNGTAWVCDPPSRFVDNEDGTVSDTKTGLMWEKKTGTIGASISCETPTDCSDPHNVNNRYRWTDTSDGDSTNPDGTLYTNFLNRLNDLVSPNDGNTTTCFAGYCDWRVPTIGELRGILTAPFPLCTSTPCVDPVFGPTRAGGPGEQYWSDTTFGNSSDIAYLVKFDDGFVWGYFKFSNAGFARAVRGGG